MIMNAIGNSMRLSNMKNNSENKQETEQTKKEIRHKGIKGMFKGIICLLFGHDWVDYNEHCYICSRCMEVAPKG